MATKASVDSQMIKTKEDVKRFFQKIVDDKKAWTECVRAGRSVAELEQRGMKFAKLSEVLG